MSVSPAAMLAPQKYFSTSLNPLLGGSKVKPTVRFYLKEKNYAGLVDYLSDIPVDSWFYTERALVDFYQHWGETRMPPEDNKVSGSFFSFITNFGEEATDRVLKPLLQSGKIPIEVLNYVDPQNNFTPLSRAAYYGDSKLVALILQAGANPSLINNYGGNALFNVRYIIDNPQAKIKIANLLLRAGVDINVRNKEGMTALEEVIFRSSLCECLSYSMIPDCLSYITYLVSEGADISNVRASKATTPEILKAVSLGMQQRVIIKECRKILMKQVLVGEDLRSIRQLGALWP